MIANKEKNFVSVVIYVYNQEKHIYSFLQNVDQELKNHFEKRHGRNKIVIRPDFTILNFV